MVRFDVEPRVGYMYVNVSGQLDVDSAQNTLRNLLGIAARERQPRILIDCTRLHGHWGPDERYAFGSFLASEVQRLTGQFAEPPRIAIYAVAPLMDPNRYTQTVATNRGAQVRASDSLLELVSWLGVK